MKKVRIRRPGLQSRYGHTRITKFIAKALRKGQHECFCRGVDCLSRSDHLPGNRGSKENLACFSWHHFSDKILREMHGSCAIEINHVQFFPKIIFPE